MRKIGSVLLGCTELPFLIKENELDLIVLNSEKTHIEDIYEVTKI